VASAAIWTVLASVLLVVLPTFGTQRELLTCDSLDYGGALFGGATLAALIAANALGALVPEPARVWRKVQIVSLTLSLPILWMWCTTVIDVLGPCAN
jgi:hypothetical protein